MILYQRLVAGSDSIYVAYDTDNTVNGNPCHVSTDLKRLLGEHRAGRMMPMPTLDVTPHQIKETTEWAFRRGVLR